MLRLKRKDEHILSALRLDRQPVDTGFNDVTLVHNSLPEIAAVEINLTTDLFGKKIGAPLVINALTGGGAVPGKINEALAIAARETGLAIAVGSQTVAVEHPEYEKSFKVVRRVNPDGLVFANIGAHVSPETALRAVAMVEADALQIHLNVPQEIVMDEGEQDFRGWLGNIAEIVRRVEVPVIAKEVGFGISREAAMRLYGAGIRHFDIGGRGGTNFIAIECLRRRTKPGGLVSWGISTAASLAETVNTGIAKTVIATGGITAGLDAAKAIALGASAAGIAGSYLRVLTEHKTEGLIREIENTKDELKKVLLMLGALNPAMLKKVPLVITGRTREWLAERGVNTSKYARRNWNG